MGPSDCVFCGAGFAWMQALAEHLLACHLGARVGRRKLRRGLWGGLKCWCFPPDPGTGYGYGVTAPAGRAQGEFACHLQRRGGLAAHVAEVLLLDGEGL